MSAVRRAGIDIGSGMTKLQIGEVSNGKILRFLYSIEVSVPFGVVFSQNDKLTDEVMDTGLEALTQFKQRCAEHKVSDPANIEAIGTEVFRKAPNGKAYLERVKDVTGFAVRLIEQEEEAELGYLTGKAVLAMSSKPSGGDLVVYDSGGGSFQIMMKDQGKLRMYLKPYGTAPCHQMLMELRGVKGDYLKSTPNPCAKQDITKLIEIIQGKLVGSDAKEKTNAAWLKGKDLLCIGGINSIGRMAADILGKKSFELADVEKILFEIVVDKTDQQLEPLYRVMKDMEAPAYVVAKMTLLYTTMLHTEAKTVHFEEIIGSCPGLLITRS